MPSQSQYRDFIRPSEVADFMSELEQLPDLDLTGKVTRIDKFYIKNGEFSDLWLGEWVENIAEQHRPGEKLAIKQLRGVPVHDRNLHEATVKKLNKCGREWTNLDHENILKVYGVAHDMGFHPAIITPYCKNGNILEYLRNFEPRLNLSQIIMLINGTSRGLQHLHENSIIHGALHAVGHMSYKVQKAWQLMAGQANVLIDDNNMPVITDFGVNFVIDHGAFTTEKKIAGPARWTAPEILNPSEEEENEPSYSQASDIFSFGMTMIEILTGKPPYSNIRKDSAVILRMIQGDRPEMPEIIENQDGIKDLISLTWAKYPKDRPSAMHVSKILERHVQGDSKLVEGPGIGHRLGDYESDSGGAIQLMKFDQMPVTTHL